MLSMSLWSQHLSNKRRKWGLRRLKEEAASGKLSSVCILLVWTQCHATLAERSWRFCPATCHNGKCVLWWTGRLSLPNTALLTCHSSCLAASSLCSRLCTTLPFSDAFIMSHALLVLYHWKRLSRVEVHGRAEAVSQVSIMTHELIL